MKNHLPLLLVCCLSIFLSCKDDPIPNPLPENPSVETPTTGSPDTSFAVDIGTSTIPYIIIDTKGTSIENEPKVAADMTIFVEQEAIQQAQIGIEFRGSTSFRLSQKKSYGIEVWDEAGNDLATSFFGFPAEEDWVLIGHIVDPDRNFILDQTLMYHHFGYELFRAMGRYASRSKYVELEINGDYQGVYMFMEKLKRDKERIAIEKLAATDTDSTSITGGYILKIDKTAGGDLKLNQPLAYFESNWEDDARYQSDFSFRSAYDINGNTLTFDPYAAPYHNLQFLETYFIYEYPKADNITADQKTYIQDYIHDFETALLTDDFSSNNRTYTDYIDLGSFVDYFIINEVCRNVDGYRLSTYLHKDKNDKLNMGPIWDLNIGYDTGDRVPFDGWVANYNTYVDQDPWMVPFWWPRLLQDPVFKTALKTRWQELRTAELQTAVLLSKVDEVATYLQSNGAIDRNYAKWGAVNYTESVNSLKAYLENRIAWMDGQIDGF